MPRDEDYFTEAEAQSKLRKRVRVKQSGGGYIAGPLAQRPNNPLTNLTQKSRAILPKHGLRRK
jgi:hypothetical protein